MSLRHREHRVALLPPDDRPLYTRAARKLARIVDYDITLPPAEMIGHFDLPGDPEALAQWLAGAAREVDSILISLDMLAYGGYVSARQSLVRQETALQRVDFLTELRKSYPDHTIYALATIPAPEGLPLVGRDVAESRAVARYGVLETEAEAQNRVSDELVRLRSAVSPDFWGRYHEMRRRNLNVNLRAVELAADGVIDFLLIGHESPAESGPHLKEAEEILSLIASRHASDRVLLVDGVSQGFGVLLVRFIQLHMGTSPAVATVYSLIPGGIRLATGQGGPTTPVEDVVRAQIVAVGGSEVDEPAKADICLYVNPPASLSLEEMRSGTQAFHERKHALHGFAIELSGWVASDRLAALADAAFPPGADEALMQALHEVKVDLTRLGGFAARESVGATVGMALAHACLRRIGLQDKAAFDLAQAVGDLRPMRYLELLDSLIDSERAHIATLFSRFVEDYLYQTRLKRRAARFLADLIADSPISLLEIANSAEEFVRTELTRAAGEFYIEHFLGRQAVAIGRDQHTSGLTLCELEETRIELPWRRLAEVYVDIDFDIQLVVEPPE
ncbi:MAG: DUF4127 family protein [Candidatus Zipacnadales bacterium]